MSILLHFKNLKRLLHGFVLPSFESLLYYAIDGYLDACRFIVGRECAKIGQNQPRSQERDLSKSSASEYENTFQNLIESTSFFEGDIVSI